jgi:hypothetical protein
MKKTIYTLLFIVLCLSTNAFAISETVTLVAPNTLSSTLVNDKTQITDLTIIGEIDQRDFAFMNTQMTSLANLDLGNAVIKYYTSTYKGDTIPSNAFKSNLALVTVTLPQNLEAVGTYAFDACANLTTVNYNSSLKYIESYAFRGNAKLSSKPENLSLTGVGGYAFANCEGLIGDLVLNEGLTLVGTGGFTACQGLTSVTLPSTVTRLDQSAFSGKTGTVSNITKFTVRATTPPTLGTSVFIRKNPGAVLYVPAESVSLYEAAAQWTDLVINPITTVSVETVQQSKLKLSKTNNEISISADEKIDQILLYDNCGRLLINKRFRENNAQIELPAKGSYIIKVLFNERNIESLKLIN